VRVVFAGTPEFAVPALAALGAAGHEIVLVLTQPDRPAGRGMTLKPSPVKAAAMRAGHPIFQPATLKDPAVQARIAEVSADIMVVVAYGLILPQAVLDRPRHGALNIHGSLLPRWRGAAPIERAILAGDAETGVAIMQMDAGLDTGPVYREARVAIGPTETAGALRERLSRLGAELLVQVLADLANGRGALTPQATAGATYAAKIDKSEAVLDWRRSAIELARCVRAFNPTPGALARSASTDFKIWTATAERLSGPAAPGEIVARAPDGIVVACGEGALRVTELQRAGSKRMLADEFVRGGALRVGERFALSSALG
jgi:methionyl-tRNA formyltransferase